MIAVPTTLVVFKNYVPLVKFITKIDGTAIDDFEDLELVMVEYNLLVTVTVTWEVVYGFILKIKQLIWIIILRIPVNLNLFKEKTKYFRNTVAQPAPYQPNVI